MRRSPRAIATRPALRCPLSACCADILDPQPGETVTVDTGHQVACDLAVQFRMRRAAEGRSVQSVKSGEDWDFNFTGPGHVLLHSRNPDAFAPGGSPPGPPRSSRA